MSDLYSFRKHFAFGTAAVDDDRTAPDTAAEFFHEPYGGTGINTDQDDIAETGIVFCQFFFYIFADLGELKNAPVGVQRNTNQGGNQGGNTGGGGGGNDDSPIDDD